MKKIWLMAAIAATVVGTAHAQRTYTLEEPSEDKVIYSGHLDLGGTSPSGGSIEVNSYYLSIDGVPSIPVTGEFHYSRYPRENWEEEIVKIKAGGINLLPTYVFWNMHEERDGVFNWSGNRDLRHFISLCAKHDMPVLVRIGPFCHGEIRNGGLPDWLFAKPLDVRSNDPAYLFHVERLYREIAGQLDGLYYKDGGPVIGIQIENEHQHSAAPWGICYPGEPADFTNATYDESITMIGVGVQDKDITTAELGDLHMRTLKDMAREAGMITPLYTATGWGMAAVIGNGALPVTSAYTYPFWAKPAKSEFLMFKDLHAHPDYEPVRYEPEKFPSFCAEMGVGIQMTYSRRPIVTAEAAEGLMIRCLGSGSNGIGYYMYHGGSTPKMPDGITSYNDEPMGMPKVSYDYQAPLGEFGEEHDSYRRLRLIHSFLADFSDRLAPMATVLPGNYREMTPDNRDDLRYAARIKDGKGFVFMVNAQDHDKQRHDQKDISLQLKLRDEVLTIPAKGTFDLPKDHSVILPFNFEMGGAMLKYAVAQPLMKIDDRDTAHWFFFVPDGMKPEYMFDGATVKGKTLYSPETGFDGTFTVRPRHGKPFKVTTLTFDQALSSCKINGKLLMTDATVLPYKDRTELLSMGNNRFEYVIYPSRSGFEPRIAEVEAVNPKFSYKKAGTRRMAVHFDRTENSFENVHEYFLEIDYTADVAMAFLEGTQVLDHFYFGSPWRIALNRFGDRLSKEDFSFYFRPLRKGASYIQDLPTDKIPDFSEGPVCNMNEVRVVPQYKYTLTPQEL